MRKASHKCGYKFWQPKELFILCTDDVKSYAISFLKNFWLACTAFGILVPQPGIKPVSPVVEAWGLNHWTSRDILYTISLKFSFSLDNLGITVLYFWSSLDFYECEGNAINHKIPGNKQPEKCGGESTELGAVIKYFRECFVHWKVSLLMIKRYFIFTFSQYGSRLLYRAREWSFQSVGIVFVLLKAL